MHGCILSYMVNINSNKLMPICTEVLNVYLLGTKANDLHYLLIAFNFL